MNVTSFVAYLKRCLVPNLKRSDIVMMDSLPVHKVAGVRELIEAAGATLRYFLNYSSDLNPKPEISVAMRDVVHYDDGSALLPIQVEELVRLTEELAV